MAVLLRAALAALLVIALADGAAQPVLARSPRVSPVVQASIDSVTCNPGGEAGLSVAASATVTGGVIKSASLFVGEYQAVTDPTYAPFSWNAMTLANWGNSDSWRRGTAADSRTLVTGDPYTWDWRNHATDLWTQLRPRGLVDRRLHTAGGIHVVERPLVRALCRRHPGGRGIAQGDHLHRGRLACAERTPGRDHDRPQATATRGTCTRGTCTRGTGRRDPGRLPAPDAGRACGAATGDRVDLSRQQPAETDDAQTPYAALVHVPLTAGPAGPPAFHLLTKPTGATCNLDCSYCFFLSKEMLYPGSRFRMADEMLEQYIRQLIEAHRIPHVSIAWQGGEPTMMGVEFFRRSVELVEKHRRPGMTVEYTIQTNGTLIDDELAALFKQHDFLVGLSVDGPPAMHDAYRVDRGGAPTFDRVMRGLRHLQDHGVEFNTLTTLHHANADHPVEVYRFLRDELGSRFMQFIPIVERLPVAADRRPPRVARPVRGHGPAGAVARRGGTGRSTARRARSSRTAR